MGVENAANEAFFAINFAIVSITLNEMLNVNMLFARVLHVQNFDMNACFLCLII